jgi:hypothetical protein
LLLRQQILITFIEKDLYAGLQIKSAHTKPDNEECHEICQRNPVGMPDQRRYKWAFSRHYRITMEAGILKCGMLAVLWVV